MASVLAAMVLVNVTGVQYDEEMDELIWQGHKYPHHSTCGEVVHPGSGDFFMYLALAFVAILFAGVMSGLTVGLMSFDEKNLSILMTQSKDEKQRKRAEKVHKMVKDHHLLLVTLLLWNAAAFESLPIFLDRLVPAYVAVILSVTLILIFGEILPQAVCTGPNRLAIGAGSYYLVMCLQVVIYPLAWAIAKLLDRLLGTEESRDSVFLYLPREQLGLKPNAENSMALVELHGEVEAEISDAEQGATGARRRTNRAKEYTEPSNQDIAEMDTMPLVEA